MTTFAPSNLPASVNTVEKLVAWGMSVLAEINTGTQLQTAQGVLEDVAAAQTFDFPNQTTSPERLITLGYLPLVPGWRATGKIWTGIGEISNTAIPPAYTS